MSGSQSFIVVELQELKAYSQLDPFQFLLSRDIPQYPSHSGCVIYSCKCKERTEPPSIGHGASAGMIDEPSGKWAKTLAHAWQLIIPATPYKID
ncbi:hypothetical protein [Gracilibacillus timonensis]|uniref:hypothetical protein n=1 Tax=Gracilibacillus timonensis TaxID=1816696 RepID=UPI0011DDD71F|nr:hypothetical protein [Gracilibacillus timonensis]